MHWDFLQLCLISKLTLCDYNIVIMNLNSYTRFVDEDGATYNAAKTISRPYGFASVFTGPKVC